MPQADWKILRPIPRVPPPSDGRRFSLSQWERAGVRVNGHPIPPELSIPDRSHDEKMRPSCPSPSNADCDYD